MCVGVICARARDVWSPAVATKWRDLASPAGRPLYPSQIAPPRNSTFIGPNHARRRLLEAKLRRSGPSRRGDALWLPALPRGAMYSTIPAWTRCVRESLTAIVSDKWSERAVSALRVWCAALRATVAWVATVVHAWECATGPFEFCYGRTGNARAGLTVPL